MELSEIKINIEFENLIPKQTAEQFKQLEENMVAEGRARNPLVLWKDHNTLVDGHNRMKVLHAHPELSWSVVEQEFANEDEAKEWIIKNALGTRNLNEMQQSELMGRLHNMEKKRRGNPGQRGADGRFQKSKKWTFGDTAEKVAKELGVNRSTVYNATNFVDGLDAAESVVPGFKDAVLTGEVKAQKQEVAAMRKKTPEEIKADVKRIEERKGKKNKSENGEFYANVKRMYALASGVTTTQYGLAELIREVDALGDSFIESLLAMLKRRQNVIDTYDGKAEINGRIDNIIEKLKEVKGD